MLRGGRRSRNSRGSPRAPKCAGQIDPINQDPIDEHYAIRLLENGHYFCHDIRELHRLFNSDLKNRFQNPVTRQPWSEANKAKIRRKFAKLGMSPVASPLPSSVEEEGEEEPPSFHWLDTLSTVVRNRFFSKIVLMKPGIQLQYVFPYEHLKYEYNLMGEPFNAVLSVSPYGVCYLVVYVISNDWFNQVRDHISEKTGVAGHLTEQAHIWPWSPTD